jgi:uncharacterized protein YdeI (YjbR/CyaY-like superfamily)
MDDSKVIFATQEKRETWLEQDGNTSSGAWLRLSKKGAINATVSCAEALESALCYGWIDGQKQAEALLASGRRHRAGLEEVNPLRESSPGGRGNSA